MDDAQKELFKKQLELYKKDLGLDRTKTISKTNIDINKSKIEKLRFSDNVKSENKVNTKPEKTLEKQVVDHKKEATKKDATINLSNLKDTSKKLENLKTSTTTNVADNTKKATDKLKNIIPEKPLNISKKLENLKTSATTNVADNTKKATDKLKNIIPEKPLEVKKELNSSTKISTSDSQTNKQISILNEFKETNNNINSKDVEKEIPKTKTVTEQKDFQNEKIEENADSNKSKKLLYLLIPVILGLLAYFMYSSLFSNDKIDRNIDTIETTNNENIIENKNEIENSVNNIENEKTSISDTIYNLSTNNPTGYYAIIGSYSESKNAIKLQKSNKTSYESYIMKSKNTRVALFLNTDDDNVFSLLEDVKKSYPNAWLMYNTEL